MTTGGEEGGENSSLGSIQIRPWQSYAGMKNMTKNQSMKMKERSTKIRYVNSYLIILIFAGLCYCLSFLKDASEIAF